MKYCLYTVFVFLAVSTAFSQAKDEAKLTGTVTDLVGAVIPGVKVKAIGTNGKEFSTFTDENGHYEILLPKADYSLIYSGVKGFADRTMIGFISYSLFKDRFEIDARLQIDLEGAMVSEILADTKDGKAAAQCYVRRSDRLSLVGEIRALNRDRIPGVNVSATERGGSVYSAATDAEGKYQLDLPKGRYTVEFSAPTFEKLSYALTVDRFGARTVDALLKGGPIFIERPH